MHGMWNLLSELSGRPHCHEQEKEEGAGRLSRRVLALRRLPYGLPGRGDQDRLSIGDALTLSITTCHNGAP